MLTWSKVKLATAMCLPIRQVKKHTRVMGDALAVNKRS